MICLVPFVVAVVLAMRSVLGIRLLLWSWCLIFWFPLGTRAGSTMELATRLRLWFGCVSCRFGLRLDIATRPQ